MVGVVGVVGSRDGFTRERVHTVLEKLVVSTDMLVSGGARGVDSYVESFAVYKGNPIKIIRPRNPSNKLDYLFRNVEIIAVCDWLIVFWNGRSKGTKFVIDYAKSRNKRVELIKK